MDFSTAEFQQRVQRAQEGMQREKIDALFFCTEPEIRYFTGFRTLFWQSPTRPWYLIIPKTGDPIAIIPSIGVHLMSKTWVTDIRSWSSPHPTDDGIGLLSSALSCYKRVGIPIGHETSLRMPYRDFRQLCKQANFEIKDCTALIQNIRMIKSKAEIEQITKICHIASNAFARANTLFYVGQSIKDAFSAFKIALLEEGAEDVPYLVGGAGKNGYSDVISPPDDTALKAGDILMLDTGATYKGYFCDFDRNYALHYADDIAKYAYEKLWLATQAGINAAYPNNTAHDLFHAMHSVLKTENTHTIGRYGHGLGIQLTEQPSNTPFDHTPLQPGMVMTIEPSIEVCDGHMMVHEENILITENEPLLLSKRAPPELPIIECSS